MKLNIIIIRHAQTEYGENNRFMGSLNIPCTSNGEREAENLRIRINDIDYLHVFSSPLIRALRTAEILFPNRNIITDENLRERGLGVWEGEQIDDIKEKYPDAFLDSGSINPFYTPINGEDIENVIVRAKNFLNKLSNIYFTIETENKNMTSNIAIITHNGIIRVMRYIIEKTPVNEIFYFNENYLQPIIFSFNGNYWEAV